MGNGRDAYRVLALYHFESPLMTRARLEQLQTDLEAVCRQHRARGSLLLADEGINGTICYPFSVIDEEYSECNHDSLLEYLQSIFHHQLRIRLSHADFPVFARLKVKIKPEIVTMNQQNCRPTELKGTYVSPSDWNALLLDPDCLVIDTRNVYEIDIGTFRNAVSPNTTSFVEFPQWIENTLKLSQYKRIAMFCTGGIRCEKASNACLRMLPNNVQVYHLEGGILAYLDEVKPEESLFDGDCYVFDKRVAVTYTNRVSQTYLSCCRACRHPLSKEDLQHSDYVEGVSCRWCKYRLTCKQKERFAARQRQIELAEQRGEVHIYDPKEIAA